MQIIDNKALLLKVRHPERVTEVIPKSKQVGRHKVLVHWGLDEVQVLHNIGVRSAPSPIERDYAWPGMFKPMDHQRTIAAFKTTNKRLFNFSDPGTGKSASSLWAADYLMNEGKVQRMLVVCPLSVMEDAWLDGVFKTIMHRTAIVAHGSRAKRVEVIRSDAEIVIINYDGLPLVLPELISGGFDLVVADEATALKNATTTRWKTFHKLLKPDTRLWLLTGTPAAQRPTDAYGIAKLVAPNNVPRYFSAFQDQVMRKVTMYKWVPKADATEHLHQILQPAIRFTKEECLDLPDIVYVSRHVPMTAQQTKYYEELRKQMRTAAVGETITAVNAATQINKLLQVACGGAVYSDTGEVVEFDARNRLTEMESIVTQAAHKSLVFVPFLHTIDVVKEHLEKAGLSVGVINGSVPASRRAQLFREFQTTPDPHVLVIQPQAAAHGITLTAADTVVWFGPVPSVETYLQANARPYRKGQENKVTIYHLYGSAAEEKTYAALRANIDTHQSLIDLYSSVLT